MGQVRWGTGKCHGAEQAGPASKTRARTEPLQVKRQLLSLGALFALVAWIAPAQADTFNLNWTGTYADSATITATSLGGGLYQATGISGYNGNGNWSISGLNDTFQGATISNQFSSSSPYFTYNGSNASTALMISFVDSSGYYWTFSSNAEYYVSTQTGTPGSTSSTITLTNTTPAPGPIPGTGWLSGLAFLLGGLFWLVRAKLTGAGETEAPACA